MLNKPFIPDSLPIEKLNWKKLLLPIGEATSEISRYDGMLRSMINPSVFLSPLTIKEAVFSSKMEGTQSTLSEVLQHNAGEEYDNEKKDDINIILNYRHTLYIAKEYLEEGRQINLSLIKELHNRLMQDVRGQDKNPGQFRKDQNWIGEHGSTIEKARFIPPSPLILNEHLSKFETYLQTIEENALLQTAIMHAQFEILHPFNDGNGRIGRILIPLHLYQRGILYHPVFYLSEYLEDHREEYIYKLNKISHSGDWQSWIEFFLKSITYQSKYNIKKASQVMALYDRMKIKFTSITKSQFAITALDTLFKNPIISSSDFLKETSIKTRPTAKVILNQLTDARILRVIRKGTGRTPSIYMFRDLLNLIEGKADFNNL